MNAPDTNAPEILAALDTVIDPELSRPITQLGMVRSATREGAAAAVEIALTVSGCPMGATIEADVRSAVLAVDGIDTVTVTMGVMTDEERRALRIRLRGSDDPRIPFNDPASTTRVFAVASGKGGVGKSSVTANLAVALAAKGLSVGILDADIYGHSIPAIMGTTQLPQQVDDMIVPPLAHGVKVISIGQFVPDNAPIAWRGPMLHRAIQQFLTDVFWGDLDVLLLDLPPGTGDIALSVAQLTPGAQLLIVTTPQAAAADVAERAGSIAEQTHQPIAGVIENMGAMVLPDGSTLDVFGAGGGSDVASRLSELLGTQIGLLGSIPLDPQLRVGGDAGTPVVISDPDSPAACALRDIADQLTARTEPIAGKRLGLGIV